MSKKKRRRELADGAAPSVDAAPAVDVASKEEDGAGGLSKTQRRKLQKKRAKQTAIDERQRASIAKKELKAARAAKASEAASEAHPVPEPLVFAADEDDHCETAPQAYADVASSLQLVARALGVEPAALRIFDPYYCNGAVVRHLGKLGFPHVHNVNEDFYATLEAGTLPAHDVVVTNPPYSGSHPQRLLDFLRSNGKPWLALMPNWVSQRDYYQPDGCFYIVPKKRYHYWTPRGRRADVAAGGVKAKTHGHSNAALGIRTSPFVSFWYAGGFPADARRELQSPEGCRVCWQISSLPQAVLDR